MEAARQARAASIVAAAPPRAPGLAGEAGFLRRLAAQIVGTARC
jgi:hypothetical protein